MFCSRFTKAMRCASIALACALIFAMPLQTFAVIMNGERISLPNPRPYPSHPSRAALAWADKELKRMSLDEKIGQMVAIGLNATFLNRESPEFLELKRQVEQNHIGGLTLFRSPVYESAILMNRLQTFARYPLLISADLEAGAGMRFEDTINFPWNMAVAATGNPDYARREGEVTAHEARSLGVQYILAPDADVNNNAANPVINVRSYGENPQDVARFVAAFVEGAQRGGVIACAKHFPGHGDTATDSHRGLPVINVSLARLESVELVPFRAAVQAGVGSIMIGHISLPQLDASQVSPLPRERRMRAVYVGEGGEVITENATLPATLSPVVVNLLRHDLHFDGLVVTDALDMSGLTIYFTPEESAARAVIAGADMLLKPADVDATIRGVRDAVKNGRITESRIDESVRKILAAKYDLGLTENRFVSIDAIDERVSSKEAAALANEIAEHAITLVRDDAKVLPLANLKPDARIFNLAITNSDDRFVNAPFNAEMRRLGHRMEGALLDERSTPAEVQRAVERASQADIVIASLYGRVRSGQANSVGIPETGARALKSLFERHKSIIGISFGNPYLLENFPGLQTYIVAYGDMPSLQQAAARAILGRASITGKLPISLPNMYARGTGIQLNKVAE